ncbi:glycosyltransferase family 2 protein [Bacteroides sp.]
MISIIIPLYNKEKQIIKTLQSVFKQTFQSFEIIIINDGSTDNSVIEVEKLKDPRIRLIHQKNAGVSAARNKGIEEARYGLIAFLDADDEWKPEYLTLQYELYQKYPECSVYACNYKFKDNNGNISNTIIHKLPFKEQDGILNNYFEVASCSHPPLWTSAVMIKKEAIKAIGGFPIGIKSGEDLLTWARLAIKYQICYSTQAFSIYYLDETYQLTSVPSRRQDINDPVGRNLKIIRKQYRKDKKLYHDLQMYIALWHKMRASTCIRYNERYETIKECFKSLKYNPTNIKVYLFLILTIMPLQLKKRIIQHYK